MQIFTVCHELMKQSGQCTIKELARAAKTSKTYAHRALQFYKTCKCHDGSKPFREAFEKWCKQNQYHVKMKDVTVSSVESLTTAEMKYEIEKERATQEDIPTRNPMQVFIVCDKLMK